eukprot:12120766-Alexandrium_andersonii.AAC.1
MPTWTSTRSTRSRRPARATVRRARSQPSARRRPIDWKALLGRLRRSGTMGLGLQHHRLLVARCSSVKMALAWRRLSSSGRVSPL